MSMGKIIILDENTANKIAAGEVIERPASVIKELVENSIDAGATSVNVEIRNGGISFIRVIDNGSGLTEDDVEIAFERHATSKIRRADDLESISSMGFRGEALASIAAVSTVQLSTRVKSAVHGSSIEVKGGCVMDVKPAGCQIGTSITVRELFFNTPARYKFLKKDSTEAGYTADVLSRIALGYPEISFKLVSNGTLLLHTPGNGDLKSAIFSVYGAEATKQLIEVNYDDGRLKITGFIGKAELSRSNRNHQSVYINRRYIRSKTITAALDAAYATFLMKNRYAFALLDIRLNPAMVDVNVHPSKMEVKFSNEQDIYRAVYHAVNSALLSHSTVRSLPTYDKIDKTAYHLDGQATDKTVFTQQRFEWKRNQPIVTSERVVTSEREAAPENSVHGESSIGAIDKVDHCNTSADAIPSEEIAVNSISNEHIAESVPDYNGFVNIKIKSFETVTTNIRAVPNLFEGTRVIGQAFSTYILLEREDELFLLDQHAAHERIRYEELKEAFAKNEPISQTLMSVIPVELTGGEYQFALSEASFFEKLGFTYEGFGTNAIILRSVPFDEKVQDIKEMFLEILDFIMNGSNAQRNSIADEVLYTMACKSAVKAHKKLDEKEIGALLDKLAVLENPYTCPHGRPAILKLRRYELEKLFKRIV